MKFLAKLYTRLSAVMLILAVLVIAFQATAALGVVGGVTVAICFASGLTYAQMVTSRPVMGANTIATGLKRDKLIDMMLRGFRRRITPIFAFATRVEANPLQGTDKLQVPYYALDTVASKDFVPANGYVFDQDSATSAKEVTINKRKYKTLSVTSSEAARQPLLDTEMLLEIKGEKLAEDIVNDVFSLVTLANFGAAALDSAASAFDSDDVLTLREAATTAHWPDVGRSLVIDATHDTYLMRDIGSDASVYGDQSGVRDGRIPKVMGFDYFPTPSVPVNGELLAGFIAYQSAALVGLAPVPPLPAVMKQLVAYEMIPVEVAPGVTVMLEYRHWGNAQMDSSYETLECNYGYGVGEAAALKRITKPA